MWELVSVGIIVVHAQILPFAQVLFSSQNPTFTFTVYWHSLVIIIFVGIKLLKKHNLGAQAKTVGVVIKFGFWTGIMLKYKSTDMTENIPNYITAYLILLAVYCWIIDYDAKYQAERNKKTPERHKFNATWIILFSITLVSLWQLIFYLLGYPFVRLASDLYTSVSFKNDEVWLGHEGC